MRNLRGILAVGLIAAVAVSAPAQRFGNLPTPGNVAISPALKLIPADAAGFVVFNNLKSSLASTDRFLKNIGVGDDMPGPLLDLMKGQMGLGEGFAPESGMAFAILNFKKHGYDVGKVVREEVDSEDEAIPPFVVLIPGKSVETVLPKAETSQKGKYIQVTIEDGPDEPMLALEKDNFVILARKAAHLDDVAGINKPVAMELQVKGAALLARSDVFAHVNIEVVGPAYIEMMEAAVAQMKRQAERGRGEDAMIAGIMSRFVDGYVDLYKEILDGMTGVDFAARMTDSHVVIEELAFYRQGSLLSKMAPAQQKSARELLGMLPSRLWVLAAGQVATTGEGGTAAADAVAGLFEELMKSELPVKLPANTPDRMKSMVKTFSDQVTSFQMVAGGAAEGNGLFGYTAVMTVKDATAVKGVLSTKAAWLQDAVNLNAEQLEPLKQLKVAYKEGVETLDGVAVDAITITHPMMEALEDEQKELIKAVLGDSQLRFFVAAPNPRTVVISFGGGTDGVSAALKAVKSGDIASSEGVAEALALMPKELSGVMLFNPANLMTLIKNGMAKVAPFEEGIPFELRTKQPVAIGVATGATDAHMVLTVPNALVKDVIRMVKEEQERQRRMWEERMNQRGGGMGPGEEDF